MAARLFVAGLTSSRVASCRASGENFSTASPWSLMAPPDVSLTVMVNAEFLKNGWTVISLDSSSSRKREPDMASSMAVMEGSKSLELGWRTFLIEFTRMARCGLASEEKNALKSRMKALLRIEEQELSPGGWAESGPPGRRCRVSPWLSSLQDPCRLRRQEWWESRCYRG